MTIVEELRQNRESGAKRLESEYKAGLLTLARNFCVDESDAEELVNRTFAAVVEGIDDYLEQSAFFAWMCQILKNIHAIDIRRKSNQNVICKEDLPDFPDDDAADKIIRDVDGSLLRDAIGRLPVEQREMLILHYFMDIPLERIAKILATPVGTVKSRLHYARKALAAKLGIAAKKPGVKALLIVLALAALTAIGAAVVTAVGGSGGNQSTADDNRLQSNAGNRQPTATGVRQQTSDLRLTTSDLGLRTQDLGLRTSNQTTGDTMNLKSTSAAVLASALALQTAIPTSASAGSVWEDALLWFNGPVDANGDGKWTGNVSATDSGVSVPRKCDGTGGASCEMPDARHGALASSNTQKLNYSTGSATVYQQSGFLIRTNDVHFTAWGNKTVAWPCLYLPQATNGATCYAQRWQMFDGAKLISGNQWTILFRCRIDDYLLEGNSAWVWCTKTDTSKGGAEKEIRIGFGRNSNNTSDKKNYVKICLGITQPTLTDLCVETNEWIEVAVVVDGRAEAHTIRASLARPNDVRWYRDYTVPYDHANYTTNFYPGNVWLGGPRYGAITSNKDNFRGDVQMFAIWNRCLSDREVCEAFGGGAPNLFRIGEENCTAEMFGGAAPAAGATVTLDPLASDKRAFPTVFTPDATFRIPFSVDKYAADKAHWLRFKAQSGSASGVIGVALDGIALDPLTASSGHNSYIWIPGRKFTLGDHVLTLSRTDGGSGSVVFDVIELGGAWSAGIVDDSVADATSDSAMNQTYLVNGQPVKYASDTWYPDSLNLKEFVRYTGRNKSGTLHRPKTVVWNLPTGAAGKFGMEMSYKCLWLGQPPLTNTLVTYVNGTIVHENSAISASETVSFKIKQEAEVFHDGENTIVLDFLPSTRTDGQTDWVAYDSLEIEPLRPKSPFFIIIR